MQNLTKIHIHKDTLSSILLFLAVILALVITNNDSSLYYYKKFINYTFSIDFGYFKFEKSIIKFVNEGLMAFFFYYLGLEMKYNLTIGEFQEKKTLILPLIAALVGSIIPALIYLFINYNNSEGLVGWGVPMSTDTAFVLAALSLMGNIIPNSLRLFIIGFSIIDDIIAVAILTLFYTPHFNYTQLLFAIFPLMLLLTLNLRKSYNTYLYYLCGILLWIFIIRAGVHGSLAGTILAFFIPNIGHADKSKDLIEEIKSSIHSTVAFFVLPLFAFVNADVPLRDLSTSNFLTPISIGCFFGLFIGKPLGIFGAIKIATSYFNLNFPRGTNQIQFLGAAWLCGTSFTVSLFIGIIAFDPVEYENQMKIGVLLASFCSLLIGSLIIKLNEKYER